MSGRETLTALLVVLEEIERLLPDDKATWDTQSVVRLAVERLWITTGNVAEEYRRSQGIAPGADPWAELTAYRNLLAHALPGDISTDRVWADTRSDLSRILAEVRQVVT